MTVTPVGGGVDGRSDMATE